MLYFESRPLWVKIFELGLQIQQDADLQLLVQKLLKSITLVRLGNVLKKWEQKYALFWNAV